MEGLCITCLSGNRSLHKLCSLEPIYKLILPEITEEMDDVALCWECISIVRRCDKFRRNVLKAKGILTKLKKDIANTKYGVVGFKSLSSLRKHTQTKIDFSYVQQESKSIDNDPDKKLIIEIDTANAIDVKLETPDEIEISVPLAQAAGAADPLVAAARAGGKHVEAIFVEPAFGFDDDSDSEVLSKVKVKMKKSKPPSDDEISNDATELPEAEPEVDPEVQLKRKRSDKVKKRGKKITFRKTHSKKFKKDQSSKEAETVSSVEPTREEILEMFTSIMFCKNQFDVDGNNAEVLVLNEAEVKARRTVLREDSTFAEAKYKCYSCIVGYEERRRLNEHNAVNHVARPNEIECGTCRVWVPCALARMHSAKHRVLFRCRVCGYCEDEPLRLLSHLRQHSRHRGTNYCWMCKTNFRNPRGLRLHKEKVHSGNEETFTCDKCGKTFNCSIYYRDHLKRHAYQPIPCKICNKICKSASAHSFHMKAHATVLSGEKFKCVECDIDFAQPVLLKNHFQTRKHMHPSEFKHICDVCGKGFLWASNLQEHVNYVHKKQTDYVCQHCSKMFVSARCMRNHIKLVHEGHKPKKNKECNICGKRFAGKKTLTDHINTHTGVRPYKCDECGDTFKQAAALFTHRRLVHQGYRKRRPPTQPPTAFPAVI